MGIKQKIDKERDEEICQAWLLKDELGNYRFTILDMQLAFKVSYTVIYKILKRNNVTRL